MGRAGRLPDVAGSRGIGTQSSMRTRRPSADPTRTTRRKASKMTAGDLGGDPSADVTAESAGGTAVEAAPDLPPDVVAAVAVPADPAVTPPVPSEVVAPAPRPPRPPPRPPPRGRAGPPGSPPIRPSPRPCPPWSSRPWQYEHGFWGYSYRALSHFKAKFATCWESRDVAVPRGLSGLLALAALIRLHSGTAPSGPTPSPGPVGLEPAPLP